MLHEEDNVNEQLFTIFLMRIISSSICTVVSLVSVLLISASTIKSHCCSPRQYSCKNRIFLYFLLVTLGYHVSLVIQLPSLRYRESALGTHRPDLKCHISAYLSLSLGWCQFFVSSWAAVYLPCSVFTSLWRTPQWRSQRVSTRRWAVAEVSFLVVSAIVSFSVAIIPLANNTYGWASGPWCWIISATLQAHENSSELLTNKSSTGLREQIILWFVPGGIVSLISLASILVVVVQLCAAYWRVKALREMVQRLKGQIAEITLLAIFLIGHFILWWVQLAQRLALQLDVSTVKSHEALSRYQFFAVSVPLSASILPFGFIVYFGLSKIQHICKVCCCHCCSHCIRRREYRTLSSKGVGSIRTSYYTCDESTVTEWYDARSYQRYPVVLNAENTTQLEVLSKVQSET